MRVVHNVATVCRVGVRIFRPAWFGERENMSNEVGSIFIPGDVLSLMSQDDEQDIDNAGKSILGPGLMRNSESIVVTQPGILRHKEPNVYWIDCHHKRYIPVRGEHVIGIVVAKVGDVYRVDVGSSENASLSYLAFEGATKRNRPDIKIGDLVYGKFSVANKDMEPELVCVDNFGRSSGLGVIRDEGFMFQCPLNLVRKILQADCCPLLKTVGNRLPYETAIGQNGRVWVKGRSVKETIAISNAVFSAQYMDNAQIKVMIRRLVDALPGI